MSTPETWCPVPDQSATDPPCTWSCSSLCELGWRPLLIVGMLRDMLLRHFAEPASIEHADLRRYVWRDDERSAILIESVHAWRPRHVELRPAVLVKRNTMAGLRLMHNDLAGITEQGFQEYVTAWVGSCTLFCIHASGASVEILASEVQRYITGFAAEVRRDLGLLRWAVTEVGAIGELEEASERFVIPVTVGWAYQEAWRVVEESLPLRRVPLSIVLECPINGNLTPMVVPQC